MMQVFKSFSNAFVLQANQHKYAFYYYGMKEEDIQRVQEVSGFARCGFPLNT